LSEKLNKNQTRESGRMFLNISRMIIYPANPHFLDDKKLERPVVFLVNPKELRNNFT